MFLLLLWRAKLDTSMIYDGCLAELKSELTSELPSGQRWLVNGIKNLVGEPKAINEHNIPFKSPPAYFKIFFGNHYIQPIAYTLMGRRSRDNDYSYLKGWSFLGQKEDGEWEVLSNYSDYKFEFGEKRTFVLNKEESYRGFMLNMTEPDSANDWALCVGQIEVHGYIFNSSEHVSLCGVRHTREVSRHRFSPVFYCIIFNA